MCFCCRCHSEAQIPMNHSSSLERMRCMYCTGVAEQVSQKNGIPVVTSRSLSFKDKFPSPSDIELLSFGVPSAGKFAALVPNLSWTSARAFHYKGGQDELIVRQLCNQVLAIEITAGLSRSHLGKCYKGYTNAPQQDELQFLKYECGKMSIHIVIHYSFFLALSMICYSSS